MEIVRGFFNLFTLNFSGFVSYFNQAPIIITWIIFLFFCLLAILFLLKFFGEVGIYLYTTIAVIAANIQVLKIVDFPFFYNPIALGTILFATTFFATDILTEYYGVKFARRNILISFVGFLLMTIIMLFTLGFKPLSIEIAGDDYAWALNIQNHLLGIFLPLPIFFVSSMIAFLLSQFFDVWIYEKISQITKKKYIWVRNNISTILSSFLDNTIFSVFAWIILNPNPLDFKIVFFTFIIGTFVLRIFLAIIDTPFIYLAKYFVPKK